METAISFEQMKEHMKMAGRCRGLIEGFQGLKDHQVVLGTGIPGRLEFWYEEHKRLSAITKSFQLEGLTDSQIEELNQLEEQSAAAGREEFARMMIAPPPRLRIVEPERPAGAILMTPFPVMPEFLKSWTVPSEMDLRRYMDLPNFGTDTSLSNLFVNVAKHNVKFFGKKLADCYIWNGETQLWQLSTGEFLYRYICESLTYYVENYKCKIATGIQAASEDREKLEFRMKQFSRVIQNVASLKYQITIRNQSRPLLYDPKFVDDMNKQVNLLPVQGGLVIDLMTGKTMDRLKEHMFSFECPVSWSDKDNGFAEKFFGDLFCSNPELIPVVQRIQGYSLTGLNNAKKFFIYHGDANAGKSMLKVAKKNVMGDFYTTAPKEIFVEMGRRSAGAHTSYLMTLGNGLRGAGSEELEATDKPNMAVIKEVVGMGDLTGRQLHGEQTEFQPTCTLEVYTNHLFITENDPSFTSKIVIIPCNTKFVEKLSDPEVKNERLMDINMKEKLANPENRSSLLLWFVKGAMEYNKVEGGGLQIPDSLLQSSMTALKETDPFQAFIDACVPCSHTYEECKGLKGKCPDCQQSSELCYWYNRFTGQKLAPQTFGKLKGLKQIENYEGGQKKKYYRIRYHKDREEEEDQKESKDEKGKKEQKENKPTHDPVTGEVIQENKLEASLTALMDRKHEV